MTREIFIVAVLVFGSLCPTRASEITGKVLIDRSISRKTVVPAVYQLRGMAIAPTTADSAGSTEFDRVAVWVEPGAAAGHAAPVNVSMRQRNRRFEPALLVIPVGSTVEFPNMDPIFHNIFSLSSAQPFDLGYYPAGQSRRVRFDSTGIVQVYCHVHSSMYGAIVVTSSPWFGKPDRNGNFSWTGVPAGTYRLGVWQRTVGLKLKPITVPASGVLRVELVLPGGDEEK